MKLPVKKVLLLSILVLISSVAFCQEEMPAGAVEVGDHTFLPSRKGKVVNRIAASHRYAQRLFSLLQSDSVIGKPVGYEVEALSIGDQNSLEVLLMPYVFEDGAPAHLPGSRVVLCFNDASSIFAQPVESGLDGIYTAPVKAGEFMGFTVFEHQGRECVALYKGSEPLFLPVSQEEYLTAYIQNEQRKQKQVGPAVSVAETLKEMEKAYEELRKVDKEAAEEFRREMESFRKDAAQSDKSDIDHIGTEQEDVEDVVAMCKKELARLSPEERKRQANYALYAIEINGSISGLVPQSEAINAQPLVKPNRKAVEQADGIRLLTVRWDLGNSEHPGSPRLCSPKKEAGFALTSDKLFQLYSNESLWELIIMELR